MFFNFLIKKQSNPDVTSNNSQDMGIDASNEADIAKEMLLSDFDRYFNYPEILSFPKEQQFEIANFFLSNWSFVRTHISYLKKHYGEKWYLNEEAKSIKDKLEYIEVVEKRRMTSLIKVIHSRYHCVQKYKWVYSHVSPRWQCVYEEHEANNDKTFLFPKDLRNYDEFPGCQPGCSCDFIEVLERNWLMHRAKIIDLVKKYKEKILLCFYNWYDKPNFEKYYKEFLQLSTEIPEFEDIICWLKADELINYMHLSDGLEKNMDNPLTQKGLDYCREVINKK
jgi:hypothetical protein